MDHTNYRSVLWPSSVMLIRGWCCTAPGIMISHLIPFKPNFMRADLPPTIINGGVPILPRTVHKTRTLMFCEFC